MCDILFMEQRRKKWNKFNIPREVVKVTKPLWSEKIEIFERNTLGKLLFY